MTKISCCNGEYSLLPQYKQLCSSWCLCDAVANDKNMWKEVICLFSLVLCDEVNKNSKLINISVSSFFDNFQVCELCQA
jgi:hypothetical protein